ncbi:hypothetical protein CZ794_00265 [Psychrobacter sp. JB385]|nr:hypothetical protein CZ794_00265 [Psychrobacter sp. JB385]
MTNVRSIGFLGLHHSVVANTKTFVALLYGDTISLMSYLWFLDV